MQLYFFDNNPIIKCIKIYSGKPCLTVGKSVFDTGISNGNSVGLH